MNLVVTLLVGMLSIRRTDSLSMQGCGEGATRIRGKIFGGKHSRLGMWPWHVGIYKQTDSSRYNIICGGALIAPQWILTAAHCFYERRTSSSKIWYEKDTTPMKKYKIIAGDIDTQIREISEQERFPTEVYIHPGYRHDPYYENDIALVKLNHTVTLSSLVRTVCLPISNVDFAKPGTVGTVAGWGKTRKSRISTVLLHTTIAIKDNAVCKQATTYFFNKTVTFCAGDDNGRNDTCQGDSGGSLLRSVSVNGKRIWVTVGLVSWGEGCGLSGKYGYYTRVHSFVDWIKNTINYSLPCLDPGMPKGGSRHNHSFLHGDQVTFSCKMGWNMEGEKTITCINGRWNYKMPTCLEITCPDPGHPHNGVRRPSRGSYRYKTKIQFHCNRNHVMMGQSSLTCQTDGTWNGFPPFCLAPCPDPGIPKGGSRHHHSFIHGDRVTFSCKKTWKMKGEKNIACNDGKWNYNAPTCLECDSPLGMESRKIPDKNIGASSRWDWRYEAYYGRLNGGSVWCLGLGDRTAYLEIDLEKPYKITYLATQGGARGRKWVSEYIVSHSSAISSFLKYRESSKEKVFAGNTDATSIVKHKLKTPFIARKIKFHPTGVPWYGRACMRVEIYGCDIPNDCVMVGSRVLGRWGDIYNGGYIYYKAIVRTIDRYNVQLEIEDEDHSDQSFKIMPKTNIVLDVPNKQWNLPSGTRVLMPLNNTYYTGAIGLGRHQKYYLVDPDNSSIRKTWIKKNEIRVLKSEQFCK